MTCLSDVFLHKLSTRNTDESTICVVGHSARKQRLARARGSVEQDALRNK